MVSKQQKLSALRAQIKELRSRHGLIIRIWNMSVQQFDLVVARVQPQLIETHRPWLLHLRKENIEQFGRAIDQLEELLRICETLFEKSSSLQEYQTKAIERISGKVSRNARILSRKCTADNERLMEVLKRIASSVPLD